MFTIVRFALGAAIGSFLNVVILRYQSGANLFGKQLGGRSHCPHCGVQLRWYELIPLFSFVLQGGRCRSCKQKISWQYPLVELAAGVIVAGVPLFLHAFYASVGVLVPSFFMNLFAFVWAVIFLAWLTLTVIDFREYLIPDSLTLILTACGVALIALMYAAPQSFAGVYFVRHYAFMIFPSGNVLLGHILGGLLGGAFFALFALLTRGRGMGWGDVKLAAASGLILGLPDLVLALFLAFLAGGLVGGIFLVLGRKGWRDRLPFGPFLVGGFIVTIFFGYQILQAYFGLLV